MILHEKDLKAFMYVYKMSDSSVAINLFASNFIYLFKNSKIDMVSCKIYKIYIDYLYHNIFSCFYLLQTYKLVRYFEYFQRKAVKKFSTAFYLCLIRGYIYLTSIYNKNDATQLRLWSGNQISLTARILFVIAIIRKAAGTDRRREISFAIQPRHRAHD